MKRLVALYPAAWRVRYEDEFIALLEARRPSLSERLDIVRGAMDARLHPQVAGPQRVADRFWYVPLVGLAVFGLALFLVATDRSNVTPTVSTAMAWRPATPGAVLRAAVGGSPSVSSIVSRPRPRWSRMAGSVAIVIGPLWAIMPWLFPVAVVFLAGVFGLAVGARRAGIMPTWGLVALVAALALPASLIGRQPVPAVVCAAHGRGGAARPCRAVLHAVDRHRRNAASRVP